MVKVKVALLLTAASWVEMKLGKVICMNPALANGWMVRV